MATMENAASRFGQRLAHTEKKYRDQALKKLTVYLTKKSEWSDLEWDKLWKALFYCMWMSDKRPIQEELSSNLASLVHKIPTPELALGFVHSFFRTMHREWHGIDGLRLDKFYSLIRKFVHESIALLRDNDWDHVLVETFVSIVSSEIISQLPNGLRMHLSDLFLEETWKAAGASVETDSFLLLLEPFFTLLSSEYDKTIFKRVRELVFAPMLAEYKFGPQAAKEKAVASDESSGETDGDDEDEDKVFEHVELAEVQHRIFTIASADDTAERNRSGLYDLYSKFFAVTKVDSLKAAQEAANKPKAPLKKRAKKTTAPEEPVVETSAAADAAPATEKKKKNKKRKKAQVEAEDAAAAVEPPAAPVEEKKTEAVKALSEEPSAKKAKKSKKQKLAEKAAAGSDNVEMATAVETTTPSAKKKKKAAKSAEAPAKEQETKKAEEEAKKAAKLQVTKKEQVETPKKVETKKAETPKKTESKKAPKVDAPTTSKRQEKTKPVEAAEKPKQKLTVVKSGVKFQRCAVCKGFGKGFLPAGKDTCGHCERKQKSQKKAAAVVAKKRKASELAASAAAAEAEAMNAKKVTFGKNKALPHDLSVKRLKASAKKEATPKEETTIKSVLKASSVSTPAPSKKKDSSSSSKKAGKGRMKAADFF